MPPNNTIILDLDPLGVNLSNRVVDEPHVLSNKPVRAVSPKLGPFHADASLIVRSGPTTLVRGTDYQVVELHQTATAKYGKEIASVILIIKPSIPANITVTYQALGGTYTTTGSNASIASLYQSVMNDNRPVNFMNIENKPTEYQPSVHRHLLEDLYGFEPVVDYLERIKQAITLGQTAVVKSIVDELLGTFSKIQLPKVLPNTKLMQYDAFLYFMSRRKLLSSVWIDTEDDVWYSGRYNTAIIDTTGIPVGTIIRIEIYNPRGTNIEASFTSVQLHSNGGLQSVDVYVPSYLGSIDYPVYLGIKLPSSVGEYAAVSYQIKIKEVTGGDDITVLPEMSRTKESAHFTYFYDNRTDEYLGLIYSLLDY